MTELLKKPSAKLAGRPMQPVEFVIVKQSNDERLRRNRLRMRRLREQRKANASK